MHPLAPILVILAAAFGPRLWAGRLLRRYDVDDERFLPARDLARRLLDDTGLGLVRVELTDLGDHYDPVAKTIRLSRSHFDRRSLTAATTVAHEVGHALQDANGYWPFRLYLGLGRVARVAGDVGTVLLIGVPVAALISKSPTPPLVMGAAAAAMLGTSLAAQLAALPSELNASFGRALPLLRDCGVDDDQLRDARRILLACSLTYVSSTLNPLMVLWPWLGGPPGRPVTGLRADPSPKSVSVSTLVSTAKSKPRSTRIVPPKPSYSAFTPASARSIAKGAAGDVRTRRLASLWAEPGLGVRSEWTVLKTLARPVVRSWLRMTGDY